MSTSNPDHARTELAQWATPMVRGMRSSPLFDEKIVDHPPDADLTGFVASGNADDCAEAIDGLLDAGADRVVLVPNPAGRLSTAEMVEQIELATALVGKSTPQT